MSSNNNFKANISKQAIVARNNLYQQIRDFFAKKSVLEVETPLLSSSTITDPYIQSFEVANYNNKLYLQTSPEFAMKKLLCSNLNSSIFQICKAFRVDEIGRHHNIEFSMLEWYRLDFNLDMLMDEMAELLNLVLTNAGIIKISYQELFLQYLNFDYNLVDLNFLKNKVKELFLNQFDSIILDSYFDNKYTKDDLLMILLSNYIEPKFKSDNNTKNKIILIYNYPSTQSALAKIKPDKNNNLIARRFEVYYNGIELANGFEELSDPKEQLSRFEQDLKTRKKLGLSQVNIDYNLIKALEAGLPECSGVALGLDRLLMLCMGYDNIEYVLVFR